MSLERIQENLKHLRLYRIHYQLEACLEEPAKENPSYPDFLDQLLTREVASKQGNEIFGDPVIATAILDRILHHATTVNIKGSSYLLKEKVKAGLIRDPEVQQNAEEGITF